MSNSKPADTAQGWSWATGSFKWLCLGICVGGGVLAEWVAADIG